MKLYLSSIEIPAPDELAALLGKPLKGARVALISNANDYYSERARAFKVAKRTAALEALGLVVEEVDLRKFSSGAVLKPHLAGRDLVWLKGGNTFCLRYEMRRSGFEEIIADLMNNGLVYGGDSAGALAAGLSIGGTESADEPAFAEEVIEDGLKLVPYVVLPHTDNAEFAEAARVVRERHPGGRGLIELTDAQAVIFEDGRHRIVP